MDTADRDYPVVTMWMASCKPSTGCTDEIFLFNYESGSGG